MIEKKSKLFNLSETQLREKLKTQLVATIGTHGSLHGCTIDVASKDFR